MNIIKVISIFSVFIILILFTPNLKSQTIYFCEANSTDGEPKGEKSKFSYDPYKDNVIYILVKFPSAYGCNQIKFRREKLGEPGPVSWVDIDPNAVWICYEMDMPQFGDYTLTVFDCNDAVIGKGSVTMVSK